MNLFKKSLVRKHSRTFNAELDCKTVCVYLGVILSQSTLQMHELSMRNVRREGGEGSRGMATNTIRFSEKYTSLS